MEKNKAYMFSATPEELTGQCFNELEEVGLANVELDVFASKDCEKTSYEIIARTTPLDVDRFVGLLNVVAPSMRRQFAVGIENDWVVALRPQDRLHEIHARLGEPWHEYVAHASPFLELVRSGVEYWPDTHNMDGYDDWLKRIPEPLLLEPDRWNHNSYSMPANELIKRLKEGGVEEAEQILLAAIQLMVDWDKGYKISGKPEFLTIQRKLEKVLQENETYKKIAAFAKLPLRCRAVVQGNVLAHIFENKEYIPEIFNGHYWCTYVLNIGSYKLGLPNFQQIIDKNGVTRIINTGVSWGFGIPKDFRALEQATITTVHHPNGLFTADALITDLGRKLYDGKRMQKTFVDYRTLKRIKGLGMHPIIAWRDTTNTNGDMQTRWDLRNTVRERMHDGIMTRIHHNGLLGLIMTAGYSKDVLEHEKLWKTERKLPKNDATQTMGAAQLPLLSLMYKRQIAQGNFINAVRREVHAAAK